MVQKMVNENVLDTKIRLKRGGAGELGGNLDSRDQTAFFIFELLSNT